jgi:hypothetical protein
MSGQKNLQYGYQVVTNDTYVAVGNPSPFNFPSMSTGSVEVFKYNSEYDTYTTRTLIKKLIDPNTVYLSAENGNRITTETSLPFRMESSMAIGYYVSDKYGSAISLYDTLLAVSNGVYYYAPSSGSAYRSGSGVDIYDLSSITSPYYPTYYITNSVEPINATSSFGKSISLYSNYLAVGSDLIRNTSGLVYIYQRSGSNWSLIQTISGSQASTGSQFGGIVKFDQSGSYNLLVGTSATGSGKVYLYTLNTGSNQWVEAKVFSSDRTIAQTLNFIDLSPYITSSTHPDGFGTAIGIYGNSIAVGAPTDTRYVEYTGSTTPHYRGAVYFYNRCSDDTVWLLQSKTFGNTQTLKSNRFGISVDIYGAATVIGETKYEVPYSASYVLNTVNKKYNSNPNDDYINILGNLYVLFKDSDGNWNYTSSLTKKKEYGTPFSTYASSVGIFNSTVVTGAPVTLHVPSEVTSSSVQLSGSAYVYDLSDIESQYQVGNVFYKNGVFCLSNGGTIFDSLFKNSANAEKYDITYDSKLTIFEKSTICKISPKEFNVSTNPTALVRPTFTYNIDGDSEYTFSDVDLILRFIHNKLYGNQAWSGSILINDEDTALYDYHISASGVSSVSNSYLIPFSSSLEAAYVTFDVDGNNKVNLNDMRLLWEHFKHKSVPTALFPYIEPKSSRKTSTEVNRYIDNMTGRGTYGIIDPGFMTASYSASLDVTGSYLSPTITTVGLYTGADLVAVAKLATPLKLNSPLPINIFVKLDM